MSNGKKILVTGGSGFIGSHLVDKLIENGNDVLCLDNLFSSPKSNITKHINNPNFQFLRHDVCVPIHLEVDEIWNLACPASPIHYQRDPVQTTKTSVLGAINVLGMAKRLKCKVFQASTSEVYGDPAISPQSEKYWGNVNPIGPRSCYDEGKRCAETLFFDYQRQHKLEIKVVRIFNTFGPRMHQNDGRVVSNFIVQALQGRNITVYGDGNQTRSFCYIDDLISGFMSVMDTEPEISGPLNLGNPVEIRISELAEMIVKMTGSKSEVIYLPLPLDDPRQRKPDISYVTQVTGWKPLIQLEQGLEQTIRYFRELPVSANIL